MSGDAVRNLIAFGALIVALWQYIIPIFKRLKIEIILSNEAELRTSEHNSLFGFQILLNTKNKDSFIKNIELNIKHEQGKIITYKWLNIVETINTITINGITSNTNKVHNALGFKFEKNSSIQLGLLFNNIDYKEIYDRLSTKLIDLRYRTNSVNCERLENDENFVELNNQIDRNLNWEAGNYNAEIIIFCNNQKYSKQFSFNISPDNSSMIREFNIRIAKSEILDFYTRKEENKVKAREKNNGVEMPIYLKIKS